MASNTRSNVAAGTDLFGGRGHIEGAVGYRQVRTASCKEARPSGAENLGSYNTGSTAAAPVTNIPQGRPDGLNFQRQDHLRDSCTVNGYEFGQPGCSTHGQIFQPAYPP